MRPFRLFAALAAVIGIAPEAHRPDPHPPLPREPMPLPSAPRQARTPSPFSRGVRGVLIDLHRKSSKRRRRGIPAGANRAAWQALNRKPSW